MVVWEGGNLTQMEVLVHPHCSGIPHIGVYSFPSGIQHRDLHPLNSKRSFHPIGHIRTKLLTLFDLHTPQGHHTTTCIYAEKTSLKQTRFENTH